MRPALAQSPAIAALRPAVQANRVAPQADFGPQTKLSGHIPTWVNPGSQVAKAVDLAAPMHVTVLLQRDPSVQAAFTKFLADQQDPNSPLYHQWLTPVQVGTLFGPTDGDVAAVTNWLTSQGLTVAQVSHSRTIIDVSGPTSTVANALRTSFAYFSIDGQARISAVSEPSIPTALVPVIHSISGLTDIPVYPQHVRGGAVQRPLPGSAPAPELTTGSGNHYMTPKDFAVIYDVNPVYNSGNTGATLGTKAQHVAIIGRSRVALTDISEFAANTAVPAYTLNTIIPTGATDPGTTQTGDQDEATLDVDRVVSTAPGAIADLVVATNASGGIQAAISYNVNTLLDSIQTISFGACEVRAGQANVAVYDSLYSTGASEGISTFVSSGDSGANGCAAAFTPVTGVVYPNSINYLCSSSYATCVGGTEFVEGTGTYWSTSNSTGYLSALSYIPEGGWNEPSSTSGTTTTYAPASSGGGPSLYVTKPTWQVANGVPADGARDTPDVSFSAAGHDGYYACLDFALPAGDSCTQAGGGFFFYFSGTSASAPGMAAVAALVNTALGKAQGNLNPLIYKLYGTNPAAFHDTTVASSGVVGCSTATPSVCNNSTPAATGLTGGQAGYLVGTGYDLVTGLGSLDVSAFITAATTTANPTVTTTLAVAATPNPGSTNQTVTLTATLTPANITKGTPTGTVTFFSNGTMIGTAAVTIVNNVATTTTLYATPGTYPITATYSGDSNYITSNAPAVNLVINATPSFNLTASTPAQYVSGTTTANTATITATSVNSFAGAVALTCTTSGITGATCALTPATISPTATTPANSTLSITTPAGTAGTLTVTVNGVSGTLTSMVTVKYVVIAPTFTMAANPTTLSVVSGTNANNTSTITLTSVNGFAGSVALTCAGSNPTGSVGTSGTCTVSPTAVTLAANGTAVATMTVTSAVGTAGSFQAIVTGTGTTAGSTTAATTNAAVTVNVTGAGFTLSQPAALSFTSGAVTGNSSTSTVTSTNGFAGTVSFTCSLVATGNSPAYPPSCAATPVTLTANGTGTTTITISSTTAVTAANHAPAELNFGMKSGAAALASLFFMVGFRRRKALRALAAFALLAIGLSAVSGCGDGGSIKTTKSSAGTYTVTVIGTGTTTGSTVTASTSATFNVTIN